MAGTLREPAELCLSPWLPCPGRPPDPHLSSMFQADLISSCLTEDSWGSRQSPEAFLKSARPLCLGFSASPMPQHLPRLRSPSLLPLHPGPWDLWGGQGCPPAAGSKQVPERTGRSPGASFWLLFLSHSRRQLPGCFLPWPRSGGEVWVWSADRNGDGASVGVQSPLAKRWAGQG